VGTEVVQPSTEGRTRADPLPYFAKVLKSQKDFAQRTLPHAQKIRPPIEEVIAHYFKH
jgi:hypothetical protein